MNTDVSRGRASSSSPRPGWPPRSATSPGLAEEQPAKTPLTRQMDRLSKQILVIGGIALVASMALNLARGDTFIVTFNAAVAFAIAAIPLALPMVVTTILAGGPSGSPRPARSGNGCRRPRRRVDLGDQHRQDRHADAEPDDRGPDQTPAAATRSTARVTRPPADHRVAGEATSGSMRS